MFTDTFYYQFAQLCEYKTLKDKNIKNNYFQVRSHKFYHNLLIISSL